MQPSQFNTMWQNKQTPQAKLYSFTADLKSMFDHPQELGGMGSFLLHIHQGSCLSSSWAIRGNVCSLNQIRQSLAQMEQGPSFVLLQYGLGQGVAHSHASSKEPEPEPMQVGATDFSLHGTGICKSGDKCQYCGQPSYW